MTTQFDDHTVAHVTEEKHYGQTVEKRFNFSFNGLDYSFVFSPPSDDPAGGATLTYVGNPQRGRLTPSEHAESRAWEIANRALIG